jgi:hypothetical protein
MVLEHFHQHLDHSFDSRSLSTSSCYFGEAKQSLVSRNAYHSLGYLGACLPTCMARRVSLVEVVVVACSKYRVLVDSCTLTCSLCKALEDMIILVSMSGYLSLESEMNGMGSL